MPCFDPKAFIDDAFKYIRSILVPDSRILAACSGGIDSTVSAVLVSKALGKPIEAVYIDDGLRRIGEAEDTVKLLRSIGLKPFIYDARNEVVSGLRGIVDPEEKRKTFRELFYNILGRIAKENNVRYVVQGTIAADIVETVKGVKTQHNVLEQLGIDVSVKYGFNVIEPLRSLYKWQVRMVAQELELPIEIIERKPFPGPGLAVRVIGEVTWDKLEILRKATKIVEEETVDVNAFQSFAVLLDSKATGIKNESRIYGYIIAVRIVSSSDALTARFVEVPYNKLRRISERITSEIPEVTRVLYDITDKPPATIEFE
ncbi:MAG: ATP-binding protein [Candidatus Methanomethylicia archaeon]